MMERRRSNRLDICIARSNREGLVHVVGIDRRKGVVGDCLVMEHDHGGEGRGLRLELKAPWSLRSRRTFDSGRYGAT